MMILGLILLAEKTDNIFNNFHVNYEEDDEDVKKLPEELPVYETTHIDTNLAIAKGLLV